jgi:hypothetical protein
MYQAFNISPKGHIEGALLIALFPSFWPVMGAQVLIGGTSSIFIPAQKNWPSFRGKGQAKR